MQYLTFQLFPLKYNQMKAIFFLNLHSQIKNCKLRCSNRTNLFSRSSQPQPNQRAFFSLLDSATLLSTCRSRVLWIATTVGQSKNRWENVSSSFEILISLQKVHLLSVFKRWDVPVLRPNLLLKNLKINSLNLLERKGRVQSGKNMK